MLAVADRCDTEQPVWLLAKHARISDFVKQRQANHARNRGDNRSNTGKG
jgi:hypothetical protein